jgi:hypothetical protein
MNKDKFEGFLIGIGVGVLLAIFLQSYGQLPEKAVGDAGGAAPTEPSAREMVPAQPPDQRVRVSHV